MRFPVLAVSAVLAAGVPVASLAPPEAPVNDTLTAVDGLEVGHHTLDARPTGCTVVLARGGAVGGVDVRGGAPGTVETDLFSPLNLVDKVHAIVLSGGSAFGLDTAGGVRRYLDEQNIGFETGVARVPIVAGAILFDLGLGDPSIRPDAACGYKAAASASAARVAMGNVGAGAGATVGKWRGREHAMKGGLGSAAITLGDGVVVAALAAVNAFGDVVDPATGRLVAGARTDEGGALADVRRGLRARPARVPQRPGQNTTIAVVATNAVLTKAQASKVAQMAHDGMARAIVPSHTPLDGDTVFALATGTRPGEADVLVIGATAADALAAAILRAVEAATPLEGYPAARDLRPR